MTLADKGLVRLKDGRMVRERQPNLLELSLEDRPDGKGPGVLVDFGEYAVLVPLETAEWVIESMEKLIELARETEGATVG